MANRSRTDWNWSKHSAIAAYIAAFFGFVAIPVMLWLGLRTPNEAAPASVHPSATLPGVRIMLPHWTPWLMGTFYAVGIIVAGYLHVKAARIRSGHESDQTGRNGVTSGDAVADFSIATNPPGNWLYGWSTDMLGEPFERHPRKLSRDSLGMARWDSPQIDDLGVSCNQTGNPIRGCSYTLPPHTLQMHPGKGGQYEIVRWICPKRGTYLITGSFAGLDDQTTIADSDVNVVINSKTSLFPSTPVLAGKGTRESFTFNGIALSAEDTVDFIVGVGPSGSHGADSTGLQTKIIRQ